MRFRIQQGSVSMDGITILDHCNLEIKGKEKIAIVGANGAGKTTLLRLIAGNVSLDADDKRFEQGIWMARNTTIGLLEQNPFMEKEKTVNEWINEISSDMEPYSKERFEFETDYHRMFTMFGFTMDQMNKSIGEFSGGEQTKIALIRLLLRKPDIMLLDEPTNHLDLPTIQWLEGYLREYGKAVIMVSHDRYFLDQVVDVVYELSHGKTTRYAGNYSAYRKQREEQIRQLKKQYKAQEEEIARLNQVIEKFKHKPKKASMARSKKKVLERMEKIENPESYDSYLYPGEIIPNQLGSKWVYDLQKVEIGYGSTLHTMNMRIKRGSKIGIIGANGSGKTTFLKTIAGILPPRKGNFLPGNHLEVAYFEQMTSEMEGADRLLEDFHKAFPVYSLEDCRKVLSRFLFRKQDVSKTISSLSGGEKSRYAFAKLIEAKPNVLLLDEPTNHLDIPSKEILESAFSQYGGTLLFITHDRYFLKQVADSLLIFEKDKVTYFPGDYEHYCQHLMKEEERRIHHIHTMEEENEALWRSLEEVPEKKRIQSARFNTEQSYTDWQLELIGKEMEEVKLCIEAVYSGFPVTDLFLLELYYTEFGFTKENWLQSRAKYMELEKQYQEICIRWYEKWLEYEEAFLDYHDA
ncbi:MAG: ABC-F family ATP-binding cassette domain-containing protein [Eubacteriales bacterium]|nr:ABC-F family ATP-binding cassette domain-containing protein [Eubacteriales bacterium]